jgi:hypothetical protein
VLWDEARSEEIGRANGSAESSGSNRSAPGNSESFLGCIALAPSKFVHFVATRQCQARSRLGDMAFEKRKPSMRHRSFIANASSEAPGIASSRATWPRL